MLSFLPAVPRCGKIVVMSNKPNEQERREAAAKNLLHNSAQAGTIGLNFLNRIEKEKPRLLRFPIHRLDKYFAPVLPGDLVAMVGQSHHGKSLLMQFWAKRTAMILQEQGSEDIVVWIDTETPIDHLALADIASRAGLSMREILDDSGEVNTQQLRNDPRVQKAVREFAGSSMTYIAPRLEENEIELTLTNIERGLQSLTSGEFDGKQHRIAAIFVDYLQSLPLDTEAMTNVNRDKQRTLQVAEDVNLLRNMAAKYGCGVIMGVQAKQEVEGQVGDWISKDMWRDGWRGHLPMPGFYDGQWSSNIFQRTDRQISFMLPHRVEHTPFRWQHRGHKMMINKSNMILQVQKQRLPDFPSGAVFVLEIDYDAPPGKNISYVWDDIDWDGDNKET